MNHTTETLVEIPAVPFNRRWTAVVDVVFHGVAI
jgi:hypothetical protein